MVTFSDVRKHVKRMIGHVCCIALMHPVKRSRAAHMSAFKCESQQRDICHHEGSRVVSTKS